MKKIYFLLITCFIGIFTVNAQRQVGAAKVMKQLPKAPKSSNPAFGPGDCDTIDYPIPDNWNLTVYGVTQGGYVSGVNVTGDLEKANYFDLSSQSYNYITGLYVYFAVANSATAADLSKNVNFKLYEDNGGTPGAQLGTTVSVPLSSLLTDVTNGAVTSVLFPSPVALPSTKKFYASVDISNFSFANNDSIAIVETSDGDLDVGTGIAWEKWSDGTWHNFNDQASWGFDAALIILPFVSNAANGCSILPVTLISFNALRNNKDITLNWNVANEVNMKGYEIEKANGNNTYSSVTFLPAHNDSKNHLYSYTDANAFSSASNIQYRLKQIDNDGKVQYSKILSFKASSALNNVQFANPFQNSLRLQLNLANPSNVSINIYDMKGSLVSSEKSSLYSAASNSIEIKSTSGLKSGTYILKLIVGSEHFDYKIIKQ